MAKREQLKRGQRKRPEKSVILLGTEGKNKTEQKYYLELSLESSNKYSLKFANGNSTDPVGIVKDTMKDAEKMCTDPGDRAFAVFDTDTDIRKQVQVNEAVRLARNNSIEIITSTPCFEVWFLQHFKYSTHAFNFGDEVIRELRRYIPNYEKSNPPVEILRQDTSVAVDRAKALELYHDEQGRQLHEINRNPSTLAHIIVELLIDKTD